MNRERLSSRLAIDGAPNLRDLGGPPARDGGRVRSGLAYRSAGLDGLEGENLAAFAELGIHTVCDLRTQGEIDEKPDALPPGTQSVVLDVLSDHAQAAPAELQKMFENPALAQELLGDGQAERYFEDAYRDFVRLPSARAAYRELFERLADPDQRPLLFHCATGKDRTGWATAALYLLLGVPDEAVLEEYLLTNELLLPAVQPWIDQFSAVGGDPALLVPILGVQESYLRAGLETMSSLYGDVEGYVRDGLGVTDETVAALRTAFVEPADR